MTLKKAKTYRLICRIFFALIGFVTPVIILLTKFDFKTESTKSRITFVGVLILILIVAILWKFKTRLYEWINSWEYSLLKYVLIGFSRVYIFILILIVASIVRADVLAQYEALKEGLTAGLNNIVFCITTVCMCQCLAYIVIYPLEQKFDYTVKRIIRKNERIEDYNDAIDGRTN